MDSYQNGVEEQESKRIGQNFCSILWAGIEEHDMPQLYYYYNNCKNVLQSLDKDSDGLLEMMMNVSKRLVGMMQMTQNLAGKTTYSTFLTQTFRSQRQTTIVRQIFPYNIVLSVNRPCSEQAALRCMDYVTAIAFSEGSDIPLFTPHRKQALIPSAPSTGFEEIKNMLNGFLIRFFEDEASRENLDNLHPLYIPKDIITPHLFALQQIKQLQKSSPGSTVVVQKNGRVLITTAGVFMTNLVALITNCQEVFNKKVHWVFGSYFSNEQPQSKFQDVQHKNDGFKSFSTVYISNFTQNNMSFVLISQQPTNLKPSTFQPQLIQLNDKLQPQGPTPPVFTKLPDQIYPIFAPIPGSIDVCGVDAAKIFRALRGVQNIQINDGKVDYGTGLIDGGLLEFFVERRILESTVITQQDETESGRSFSKQGEFYAFGENPSQSGGLLSGGKKLKPLIIFQFRKDEGSWVKTVGSAPLGEGDDTKMVLKAIAEAIEVYLRVEW
ncbi:Conserved_hypothetical protein [Hexamita inflata]|uniref:Uncharacterized protein n=1 Tax=Hexamita inflata TaxID=28002 RepID=A0AA86PNN8_9EUKA|nr:Conserved hypothetical protein [Hexamita inflata]